ncbi:hypothetical protein H5410_027557 [Solanum commersonii]|uniref:Uncharacterized protein n=1 Tax=Solanum commersonii TaxID=4109 RepID=A0A9J5YZI2_SOLCO|nr:hypothetical protein H5410_027557 [Solanum commersonii]
MRSKYDYYYDMKYVVLVSSFISLLSDVSSPNSVSNSTISSGSDVVEANEQKQEKKILDLYFGCGGMSTVLCLGADVCSVKLKLEQFCASCFLLKSNKPAHPSLKLRDEDMEDDDDDANNVGGSGDNDE